MNIKANRPDPTEWIRPSDFQHQWVEDILFFEGPILSLLKASTAQDFFYYWCGPGDRAILWLAFEVSRADIQNYKQRDISLLELIQSKDHAYLVTIGEDEQIRRVRKVGIEGLPDEYLPPEGSYFDPDLSQAKGAQLLEDPSEYRIALDGNWFLEDLVEIPRVYNQLYSFVYTLRNLHKQSVESNAREILSRYPWRGGYSAVNFYSQLNKVIPSLHEPKVLAMNYASPGSIRLELLVNTSKAIRDCISATAKNADELDQMSKRIRALLRNEGLTKQRANRPVLRLSREAQQFLKRQPDAIAEKMSLEGHVEEIRRLAGNDLLTVKILLSFYRRIVKFSTFQQRGMIAFD